MTPRLSMRRASEDTADETAVREARLRAARSNSRWEEIADDLVPRGRGYLVSAETDAVYTLYRGAVFETGSATVIADRAPIVFAVTPDGGLRFLEKSRSPKTWSEVVRRKTLRGSA